MMEWLQFNTTIHGQDMSLTAPPGMAFNNIGVNVVPMGFWTRLLFKYLRFSIKMTWTEISV